MPRIPNYSVEVLLASINLGRVRLPLTHSRALDVIAHLEGCRNWHVIGNLRDATYLKERARIVHNRVNSAVVDGKLSSSAARDIVEEIKRVPTFLYRGVSPEERAVARLLAKRQGPFAQEIKIPFIIGRQTVIGPSVDNAAVNHQKNVGADQGLFETSGISTTTLKSVAIRYATHNGTRNGYMVTIRRDLLPEYGVNEYDVVARSSEVQKPEDKEVILYMENGGPFPDEIIEENGPVPASKYRPRGEAEA